MRNYLAGGKWVSGVTGVLNLPPPKEIKIDLDSRDSMRMCISILSFDSRPFPGLAVVSFLGGRCGGLA